MKETGGVNWEICHNEKIIENNKHFSLFSSMGKQKMYY